MPSPKSTFPCDIGPASWNGEETGITVTIHTSDHFGVEDADEMFNAQRIDAELRLTPKDGEDVKQKKLVDDAHAHARVTTDVGGYSRSGDEITFRLKIPKDRMNGHHSDDFGPGKGLLRVHGWEPIPEKAKVKSKPAPGQQTFDSHEDLGPTPRQISKEPAEAPAKTAAKTNGATNGATNGSTSHGKKTGQKTDQAAPPATPTKTAFEKSSVAPDGTHLSLLANARARAKKPPSLEWTAGFEVGCHAGMLDKDIQPPKLKGEKLQGWQDGYLITRAEK